MRKIKIFNGPDKIKNLLYPPSPKSLFFILVEVNIKNFTKTIFYISKS
jgi:hypothetical protein